MRPGAKALLWAAGAIAAWTGVMAGLSGGLEPIFDCDSRAGEALARWRAPERGHWVLDRRLLYLGDSNCYARERGAGAGSTAAFRDLLAEGVQDGRLGAGWSFEAECLWGRNGYGL